jgi:membrane protein YdbS with pleckstrin-like domain
MIAALVRALRPLLEPLLKLRMAPPHLPEGAAEVRHLKPAAGYLAYRYVGVGLAAVVKTWILGVLGVVAVVKLGALGLLVAVPLALLLLFLVGLTAVATRLDWELRDYLIGDRSLRVRQGALVQREVTLSFANVQNVEVTQGPLERLFGFQSLKVTTAGGGHSASKKELFNSHEAILAGLTNAEEIREIVMDALRRRKDAGLGDADDARAAGAPARAALAPAPLLEVLQAARELRAAAEALPRG